MLNALEINGPPSTLSVAGSRRRTRLAAFLLTSVVAVSVSGCQTPASQCDGWRPIRPTSTDVDKISDGLATALLEHNTYGARLCGWRAQ
jgi:hypothetical protein